MRKFVAVIIALCFSVTLFVPVNATEAASELTALCEIVADGKADNRLTDNSIYTYLEVNELNISCEEKIYGVYIKFDREPEQWKLLSNGTETLEGSEGFLHQYIPLKGVNELAMSFEEGTYIADLFVFGEGELPSFVHIWEQAKTADIMVCPTHSDDDQLYFAGMIPWCVAKGYTVQVVYLTNHLDTHDRHHELLEGLWHCGVKYYPQISEFPDIYSESFEQAKQIYSNRGYAYEGFVSYYHGLLQKYQPLVVAGHDINGEYGHGMHMLSFHALTEAIELSAREGLWDVPKTYIHLWDENQVVFNWDEELEFFDGKSAFNISQEGFDYHKSQHRFTGLTSWLYGTDGSPITLATQVRSLSPCRFGLYRSTVGLDTAENSLFENITSRYEQEESVEDESYEYYEEIETSVETTLSEAVESEEEESRTLEETTEEAENKTSSEETQEDDYISFAAPKDNEENKNSAEKEKDYFPLILLGGAALCFFGHIIIKRSEKD